MIWQCRIEKNVGVITPADVEEITGLLSWYANIIVIGNIDYLNNHVNFIHSGPSLLGTFPSGTYTYSDITGYDSLPLLDIPVDIDAPIQIPYDQPEIRSDYSVGHNSRTVFVHVRDLTHGWDLVSNGGTTISWYPASTVKLMTMLLAYEIAGNLWSTESLTYNLALDDPGDGISQVPLQDGDTATWKEMVYGIALPSGSDAANLVARVAGDRLYSAAGNTGSSGLARFVERMNDRGTELGMSGHRFVDAYGYSGQNFSNLSAKHLNLILGEISKHPELLEIIGSTYHTMEISSGPSAPSVELANTHRMINGPSLDPSGFKDDYVIGGKTGTWNDGIFRASASTIMRAPNGNLIGITTLESPTSYSRWLDQRGVWYKLLNDFQYLSYESEVSPDDVWESVKVLIGADDGAIVDESSYAHTVNVSGITVNNTNPIVGDGSMVISGNDKYLAIPDSSEFYLASLSKSVFEMMWKGPGAPPGVPNLFAMKNTFPSSTQREWAWVLYGNEMRLYASSNGSSWDGYVVAVTLSNDDIAVLYNGAPRHMAFVKFGTEISLWINGEKMGGKIYIAGIYNGTGSLYVGTPTEAPIGTIDEIRYTVGDNRGFTVEGKMKYIDPRKLPRS